MEIFRLQTADSDSDIVGARLLSCQSSVVLSRGLVTASQRRVRCGVCFNCSRGGTQLTKAKPPRCLHPVNYYKLATKDNRPAVACRIQKEVEADEEMINSPRLTAVISDVKTGPTSEADVQPKQSTKLKNAL